MREHQVFPILCTYHRLLPISRFYHAVMSVWYPAHRKHLIKWSFVIMEYFSSFSNRTSLYLRHNETLHWKLTLWIAFLNYYMVVVYTYCCCYPIAAIHNAIIINFVDDLRVLTHRRVSFGLWCLGLVVLQSLNIVILCLRVM